MRPGLAICTARATAHLTTAVYLAGTEERSPSVTSPIQQTPSEIAQAELAAEQCNIATAARAGGDRSSRMVR